MKKKIIIAVLFVIISLICGLRIAKVNKAYVHYGNTYYDIGEEIDLDSYSVSVEGYRFIHGSEYTGNSEENNFILVVDCKFKINSGMKGFPYGEISVFNGSFRQGISRDNIERENESIDFSKRKEGEEFLVKIPFTINQVSFPYKLNEKNIKKGKWYISFSVTPGKYVELN